MCVCVRFCNIVVNSNSSRAIMFPFGLIPVGKVKAFIPHLLFFYRESFANK